MKLSHQTAILIAIPVIFQIAFVAVLSHWLNRAETEALNQSRAKSLISQTAELGKMLQDAGLLLYTYKFAKSEIFNQRFENLVRQAPLQLEVVKQLAGEENAQSLPMRQLEASVNESLWVMQHTHRHLKNKDISDQQAETVLMWKRGIGASRKVMASVPLVQRMARFEDADVIAQKGAVLQLQKLMIAGVVFNVALAALLAFVLYRGTNKRLSVLMENSSRLAGGQNLLPQLSGRDELSTLDSVFHRMAGELKDAQEKERAIVEQDKRHREEIDRLKQEFVAMISHDLRTPLMSVQADLTMLAEGVAGTLTPSGLKYVSDAERNTEYVISLINNLLDVERLAAGKLELDLEDISTIDLCERAVEAVNALAKNKKISIKTNVEDLNITVDTVRLTQVLVNLLSNAVKFSSENGTITVSAKSLDEQVEFRIQDQGRGIPADQLESVFDRFHQVRTDDAKVHKGTGLGLAICKSLVEEHGGKIGVESEEGKGCTFWFRIPN